MVNLFYDGWLPLVRTLVVGSLAYVALLLLLRTSGKRTLAQMNSFDFVVTVAIGATFGRVLTARSIPLAEAVVALSLLVTLQYVLSWLQTRSSGFSGIVTNDPTILAYDGEPLPGALRTQRLTDDDLLGAVRKHGFGSLAQTRAVVLETDGNIAVIGRDAAGDGSALEPVRER